MHRFLTEPGVAGFSSLLGAAAVKATIAEVLASERAAIAEVDPAVAASFDALLATVVRRLAHEERRGLVGVLNGTGILLHTNLGRAPLAAEALAAVTAIAGGYSNLEFDLDDGVRGSRYARLSTLLRDVSGADDALVVNNCAAAVLLVLDTLAKNREVVVSRNQLIEIGGGFRLPDVLARSGATLVEVGATNKVYLADFERALSPRTALLLRSHTSNYRIEGFTADVAAADLARLGRRAGVPTMEDLGSGTLVDLRPYCLPYERTVPEAVRDGIDLVAFSADKLLGGPQAGIIVGRAAPIARMRANPLLRALRVDKATLAALAATLRLYSEPDGVRRIPFYAMLSASTATLEARGAALVRELAPQPALRCSIVVSEAYAGGGAAPLAAVPSRALAIRPATGSPNALAALVRTGRPPLVGRVEGDALLIDLRTIPPERDADVLAALAAAGTA